jgi:hypothetical protein
MATLVQLQARLETLKTARASGLRSVEYAGRRTEYRSDVELASAITALEKEIATSAGTNIVRGFRFIGDKAL